MKKITLAEFNAIPTFFHNGQLCVDIDGQTISRRGLFNLLVVAGLIIM